MPLLAVVHLEPITSQALGPRARLMKPRVGTATPSISHRPFWGTPGGLVSSRAEWPG